MPQPRIVLEEPPKGNSLDIRLVHRLVHHLRDLDLIGQDAEIIILVHRGQPNRLLMKRSVWSHSKSLMDARPV